MTSRHKLFDHASRILVADLAILFFVAFAFTSLIERTYLLAHPPSRWLIGLALLLLAAVFAACCTWSARLADRCAFARPRSILWFLPLTVTLFSGVPFVLAMALPPTIFGPTFWNLVTGFDTTRFQKFVSLLSVLLTLNCLLSIAVAVHHYFRYHLLERVSDHLGDGRQGSIGESPRAVLAAMTAILAALILYVSVISPDYLSWWRTRIAWRLARNAPATAPRLDAFVAAHPESRFVEAALFLLGRLHEDHLDRPEAARGNYTELCRRFPDSPRFAEANLKLVRLEWRVSPDHAIKRAKSFVEAHPVHPLADDHLLLAAELLSRGAEASSVEEILQRIEREYPDGVIFHFDRHDNYQGRSRSRDLAEALRRRDQPRTVR